MSYGVTCPITWEKSTYSMFQNVIGKYMKPFAHSCRWAPPAPPAEEEQTPLTPQHHWGEQEAAEAIMMQVS